MSKKKWTYEACYEAAKKCKTLKEFYKQFPGAYSASNINGWLEKFDWLERKINVYKTNSDNVYAYFFNELKSVYIGRTVVPYERDIKHNTDIRSSVYKFAHKNGVTVPNMTILESGLTLEEGLKTEDYYVRKYREEGWNVLNKAKTGLRSGALGTLNKGKWNKKTCYEEAKKYKTKSEFSIGSGGAYNYACKHDLINEYIWFEDGRKKSHNIKWTEEACYKEAKKYKTLIEFQKGNGSAYEVARKNGRLKDYTWFVDGNKIGREKRTKWDKDACKNAALGCSGRDEFHIKFPRAYDVSLKNNWLDEWFPKRKRA